jgi:catechol 2,3-dioxygenase-like lactoylglutathione lyase family enzyme
LTGDCAVRDPGIDHIVFRARDVPRLVAFYVDALGCTIDGRSATWRNCVLVSR